MLLGASNHSSSQPLRHDDTSSRDTSSSQPLRDDDASPDRHNDSSSYLLGLRLPIAYDTQAAARAPHVCWWLLCEDLLLGACYHGDHHTSSYGHNYTASDLCIFLLSFWHEHQAPRKEHRMHWW